jgi:hypothetical protein
MMPPACDADSAIAVVARSGSSRRRLAQAAPAPMAPKIPVGCQPLR